MKLENIFPDQHRHVRFLIGLYINRKRREMGMSVADVASKTNTTPKSFKMIEAGRAKLTSAFFEELHSLLGFSDEELHEIRKIASVTYINDLSKVLVPNYPA